GTVNRTAARFATRHGLHTTTNIAATPVAGPGRRPGDRARAPAVKWARRHPHASSRVSGPPVYTGTSGRGTSCRRDVGSGVMKDCRFLRAAAHAAVIAALGVLGLAAAPAAGALTDRFAFNDGAE